MDLFEGQFEEALKQATPLALKMRPQTLEGFVGQQHIVGEGKVLRNAIAQDNLGSAVFWGPPGSGKTTLASIVTKLTKSHFDQISAVDSNLAEVRKLIDEAADRLKTHGQKTILFIDEIHRFNKAQQDALLSGVEKGIITLISTTTENPYAEVNSPLISRSRVFEFKRLNESDIKQILDRALKDKPKGLANYKPQVDLKALEHIVNIAGGDARSALNSLEAAVLNTIPSAKGKREVTFEIAKDASQKRVPLYDKDGEYHFNIISAFIKSMRGSDPDATLYWLARMLQGGEDPKFIARRIIIAASEDVGLADSKAIEVAVVAARAVEFIGLPEVRINLAHAALYVARAPKSNSVIKGIDKALSDVKQMESLGVPKHLREASSPGGKKLGYGKAYKYPHDYSDHTVKQDYLPRELKNRRYYFPSEQGEEQ